LELETAVSNPAKFIGLKAATRLCRRTSSALEISQSNSSTGRLKYKPLMVSIYFD